MSDMTMNQAVVAAAPSEAEHKRAENHKFAMWLYLASEVVIFATLIGVYIGFRVHEPDIVKQAHEDLSILLVTANTFLLLTSSWAMVMGLRAVQMGRVQDGIRWLWGTAILGVIFMGGQYLEYTELAHLSVTLNLSDDALSGFGMRFYVPTFFHGLHVLVGVLWCLLIIRRAQVGHFGPQRYTGIEVFGLYWHFVDVVWIILFTFIYLV